MALHEHVFTIIKVHDGDTVMGILDLDFNFSLGGAKPVSLRFYGINAPELVVTVNGHRVLQQSGEDSTQHLMGLLGGADLFEPTRTPSTFGIPGDYLIKPGMLLQMVVRTRINPGDNDYDKYGRILARCTLGASDNPYGLNIGAQMLADGFAVLDLANPTDEQP